MDMYVKSLVYFVVMLFLTFCIKLAALILRRILVSWRDCFLYALGFSIVTTCVNLLDVSPSDLLPALLPLLPRQLAVDLSLLLPFGSCAWYFQRNASRANGMPLGWLRAWLLSLLAFVLAAVSFFGSLVLLLVFFHVFR